tara:strand:+ start:144 stop:515 length:372 start_codon:yes stop_codon:yes gene_type:complete
MKKILFIFFCLISFNTYANEKMSTFDKDIFLDAQKSGKTIVVNSWNKTCSTCAAQVAILKDAKKEFKDVLFLSFEQTVDKDVASFLKIDYWTTIVVYKNNQEISRTIGETNKSKIYANIKKGI